MYSHVGAGHDPLLRLPGKAQLLQEGWESDAGSVVLGDKAMDEKKGK